MDEDFFRFDPEDDDEDLDNAAPFGEDEDMGYDGYRDGLPLVSSRLPDEDDEAFDDEPEDEAEEPEPEDEVEEEAEPELEDETEEPVFEDDAEDDAEPVSEDDAEEPEAEESEESKEEQPAISSDLIRGHINTIILRSLYDGDKYGYEIIAEIEHKSHGQYTLKQPSLYSALKRLEKDGYITSYWGGSVSGGRRKYFSLTDEGKEIAERNQTEWEYSRTVIDSLISDKAFDFSEPAPTAVDMRVLKQSTSRVPDRDDEEYDGEEYEQTERDDLEARRAAFEEERARYEESLRVREEVLRAREEAGTKREQELLEREFALAGEERKREEEAEQRRLEEEAEKRRLEEEAEQRRLKEEAEQRRLEEEAEQRRLEEEAEQRRLEEEAEQRRLEEEAEQRRHEEEAEQRRLEEEAEQRRLEEEAEQRRLEEEAAERQRLEEEERRRAAGETLFSLSDVDRARAVSLSREKEEQNARIREMEPFAEERARYEQRLRDQEEEFLAMHERELAEQEARIREEDEKLFRRREQQIIHQNYLNLVNGGQDEPPVGNNSYYYEPQPSAEDYAYVSKPEAEREYRSIIRRLYNGAVPQEEESAPLPAPEPAPVEASVPASMPAPMPTPAPAPESPAPRVHETEEKQEKEEKPAPRVHAGRRLDGVDFYDLESLAAQDGIRISTSGGRRKEPEPRSESLVHRGKALFFSALVVFLLCLAEGSIALGFQSRLKLPAFYPYFIWGTGTALLLVTFLMYINHFGERSLRRTGNLLINVIVAYALCVIVILIVALTAKADFTDIGQLMTYVILPAIYFFSIVVFGIAYYLQVRPLNE